MRIVPRSLAVLTVTAAALLAPVLTTIVGVGPTPAAVPVSDQRTGSVQGRLPLSSDWGARIARYLQEENRVPIDSAEIEGVIRAVESSAQRFGFDPLTILAIVHVESGFDPYAVSPAGARGLMQVRAETAREIAPSLGIAWASDDLLFDPEVNILVGSCYLRRLVDRFGSFEVALAAFHAGPNRIAARNLRLGNSSIQYAGRIWNAFLTFQETARV